MKVIDAKLLEPFRKDDSTLNYMLKIGIPLTRTNYIWLNWGGDIPKHWTPEHENEIPEPLRDWSRVDAEPPQQD